MHDGETENGVGSDLLPADLLQENEGGVVRIGRSRISLDLVVECYENGQTPEDIVRKYDSLPLADAYSVIGFYLRNRERTRAYLTRRAAEAEVLRGLIETAHPPVSRTALEGRRGAPEEDHAAAGQ